MLRGARLSGLVVACVCLWAATASARPSGYVVRRYTTADGLSQSTVYAIAQDSEGYLWVGTENGLNRFDGVRFQHFDVDDGLVENSVAYLFADREGRVWISQEGAVVRRGADGSLRVFHYPGKLGSVSTQSAVEDDDGVHFGAADSIIDVRGDALSVTHLDLSKGRKVYSLLREADGAWLCGDGKGLLHAAHDGSTVAPAQAPLDEARSAFATIRTKDGALYVGGYLGVRMVREGVLSRVGDDAGPNDVLSFALDLDGRTVWAATRDGAWRLRGTEAVRMLATTGSAYAVVVDREGDVWTAAFDGLYELAPTKIDAVTRDDGLPNDDVYALLAARDGGMWVGTSTGVARVGEGGAVRMFGPAEGLTTPRILSLFQDARGRVCAGAAPGLFCMDEQGRLRSVGTFEAQDEWVFAGTARADGKLLVSTGALVVLDGDRVVDHIDDGQLVAHPDRLYPDRAGRLWIGSTETAGATVRLADGSFRRLDEDTPGMPKAGVLGMTEDGAGRVWLASDHGLLQVEGAGDRVHAITRRDGLPDEDLHCVLADDDGAIWVSTDHGLARVEGDRVVARYTTDDGLPANEGRLACAKDARGRLWFGTSAGAAIVDPHHLPTNVVAPLVHIEGVTVDGRAVDLAAGPLSLPYGKSTVVFDFTATSLADPRAMRFEYQLEGFDRSFVSPDTPVAVRRTTYTNLSPGAYTFVVRATNNDGVWSTVPARLGLRVLTPWWSAWWALSAYGAGVLLLGAGTIRVRTMALRRRADALERKVSLRTEELDQKVVQLAQKNEELSRLNGELVASQQRADRIFSALAEALPGTVLDGKYKLEERIGEGGFGAVFRARHLELRIPVAVKVFRPAPGNDSAEGLERFRREAATACRVNHPNAIKVHDSGISGDGIAYLVMELLVGESLASELARERRVSLARCAAIVPRVCAALQAAHDAGIIHRDVKPANVFLHVGEGGEEVVKVVDFGIARMMVSDASTQPVDLTRSQAVLGTPAFVAPERLLGKAYDGKSDVYSVGVMTYLMLSGRLPYEAIAGESYFARVLAGAPTPLRWHVDLPQEVEGAVLRAISPSPSTRPDASAFAEELAAAIGHLEDAVRSTRLASARPAPPPSKSIATDATVRSDDDVLAKDGAARTGNGTSSA